MTTLTEYYKMLSMHDWHYQYSDDHRVWRNGQDARDTLTMIAIKSPAHQKLFNDYANYIYSDTPKPEVPVEISPDLQDA